MMNGQYSKRYLDAIGAAVFLGFAIASSVVQAQDSPFQDGKAAFVVSDIGYVFSKDSNETGACPDGRSLGYREVFQHSAEGPRREGESDKDYSARINQGARQLSNPNGESMCMSPEKGAPDPFFRTVTGKNVPVDGGLDLDGQDSRADRKPAAGTCSHDDFIGVNGERGIDNQFFRAVGCINSYQPTGNTIPWVIEMYTGSWGILITLSGVDDLRNDPDVEVGFYANADPIQLSPTRVPLEYATYAIEQDARFRTTMRGRIMNGVLTTDPAEIRVHKITNSIHLERVLQDARLRLTVSPEGTLEGFLAGYTPVEDMYDLQFGFRNGKDAKGDPAALRLRVGSSTGAANNLGYTCEGAYAALKKLADGHRDPVTGSCTAISTQYHLKAIPAYVVDMPTKSINDGLDKGLGK